MDAFDFSDDPKDQKKKTTTRGLILNLGALYFLASSFCLIGYFIYTFIDPYNTLNPFPPATQIAVATATPTITLPPSQTPIIVPSATNTLLPPTYTATNTPTLTFTPTATDDSITLTPTVTEISIHFSAQTGTPVYAAHPDGCDGIYLVGNVIDLGGSPLPGITVDAGGSLGGATISTDPVSSGDNINFSPSGWQIKISDSLIASTSSVYVALYGEDPSTAISDLVFVDTYNDCDRNMIMVNFVQDQ